MPARDPAERAHWAAYAAAERLRGKGADERRQLTEAAVMRWRELDLAAVDAEAAEAGESLTPTEREFRAGVRRRARMARLRALAAQRRAQQQGDRRARELESDVVALSEVLDQLAGGAA